MFRYVPSWPQAPAAEPSHTEVWRSLAACSCRNPGIVNLDTQTTRGASLVQCFFTQRYMTKGAHAEAHGLSTTTLKGQLPLPTGFTDSNAYLRELTLKSMLSLAPLLSQRTISQVLLKHLAKLQARPPTFTLEKQSSSPSACQRGCEQRSRCAAHVLTDTPPRQRHRQTHSRALPRLTPALLACSLRGWMHLLDAHATISCNSSDCLNWRRSTGL